MNKKSTPILPSLCVLCVLCVLCGELFSAEPSLSSEGRFVWEPELRVRRTERIFADPHQPRHVWVATAKGIMESRDEGGSWELLPSTAPTEVGRIADVLFAPLDAQLILLASRERGIFRSIDGGKTWQVLGTPANGLKSLQVLRLACDEEERRTRVLYATHGDAAAGISKSIDGGKTWFGIAEHLCAQEILLEAGDILVSARRREEDGTWGIYQSQDSGETFGESARDVRCTAAGVNRIKHAGVWFGVQKGKLLHRVAIANHEVIPDWQPVGPPKDGQWASIFGSFGRDINDDVLYAYDPAQYGLVASRDEFKTWWTENSGLFDGPLVKEGASVCASANGKVLYASINGQLYVGRLAGPAEGPVIVSCEITPSVVKWVKDGPIQFTAKVLPFDKDPKSKIKQVWANIGHIRGPGNFALVAPASVPAGKDAGQTLDGVFSGTFAMGKDFPANWHDRRQGIPGEIIIQVSARDDKNRQTAENLPLYVLPKPESFVYWDGENVRWGGKLADGCRSTYNQRFDPRNGIVDEIETDAHAGKRCLRVHSARGPWVSGWGSSWTAGKNLTDMDYVSFWIKGHAASKTDVKVMLSDAPSAGHEPHLSSAVWLIKDGFLQELKTDYQQVRVPITKFLRKTEFILDVCGGIAFGGDDPEGHNFYVDDICMEVEGSRDPAPPSTPQK